MGDLTQVIVTVVIGGLIGWVASILMKTNAQMGLVANVIVGIIGAVVGHWLAPKIGIAETTTIARYLVALGGAVLLIMALRFLGIFK